MGTATIFRRFDLELFDTPREMEVDVKHIVTIGLPDWTALGIRVKVSKVLKD